MLELRVVDGEERSVVCCVLEGVDETDQSLNGVGTEGGGGRHHHQWLQGENKWTPS